MSTLIKNFSFQTDSESWVGTTADGRVTMRWCKLRSNAGSHLRNNPILSARGVLSSSSNKGASSSEDYWEYTGTWEDLGVPVGATVTNVKFDYQHRWLAKANKGGLQGRCASEFLGTETGAGPAEFRKSDGTLIDTFSVRSYAIDRTAMDQWVGYPQDPSWPHTPTTQTEFPISENPVTWTQSIGDNLAVPAPQQASNTQIKLRINHLLPAMPDTPKHFIKLRFMRFVATITYTTGATRRRVSIINTQ